MRDWYVISMLELKLLIGMKDDYSYVNPFVRRSLSEDERAIISFLSRASEKGYAYALFTQRITPHKAVKKNLDEIRKQTRSGLFF